MKDSEQLEIESESLALNNYYVPEVINQITTYLDQFTLSQFSATCKEFYEIFTIKSIMRLVTIDYPKLTDWHLGNLTNLTMLNIEGSLTEDGKFNSNITDASLSKLTNLTWLILEDARDITPASLSNLTNLRNLKFWDKLNGVHNNLSSISTLTNLGSLSFENENKIDEFKSQLITLQQENDALLLGKEILNSVDDIN